MPPPTMNSSLRAALKHLCLATLFLLSGTLTHADTLRPFNPSNPTDPYGLNLAGETVITSTGYDYHHWGVLLDETVTQSLPLPSLSFTALSTVSGLFGIPGSFTLSETDMFVNRGTTVLDPFDSNLFSANFTTHQVTPSGVTLAPGLNLALIRRYHFSTELYRDTLSTPNFDVGAPERLVTAGNKKLVVLIHGWNSGSSMDSYDETDDDKEFLALRRNIGGAIVFAPDWSLILYRWAQDADTGPKIFEFNNDLAIAGRRNGSEAAESGHRHGKNLGQLLADLGVEKVHFIAHSAGTWAARSAAERVLHLNPNVKVQITLLDPFIPGVLGTLEGSRTSGLTKSKIDGIQSFGSADSVFRLENYFSDDVTGAPTEVVFSWRSRDENGLEVGGGALRTLGFDPYGGPYGHFGPIHYYADTVHATSAQVADLEVFDRLSRARLVDVAALNAWGWRRSMFMQEPVIRQQPVRNTVALGSSASFAIAATTRLAERLSQPPANFTIQWQKLNGSATPVAVGTGATLQISQANTAHAGTYRAKVSSGTLVTYSDSVSLTVTGSSQPGTAPALPSNFVATAVSSSQINLSWSHSGSNVSGFELQRRLGTGTTWVNLPSVGATWRTFANTSSLSADTAYSYRIRAVNGATPSAWSAEASARTFLPPASNVNLTVYAVDATSLLVPLNVSISTWTGNAQDFATLNTNGAAGFTRAMPNGVSAWFSCPPTLPDGRRFQFWLFGNGATALQDYFPNARFDLSGNTTAYAHYAFAAPPVRTLTALAVEGSSSVNERSSATYRAKATFSDGSTPYVNASWDENSSYADISSGGVLDTEAVTSDRSVTVEATYTSGGVTRVAPKNVTIRNTDTAATYTLSRNVVGSGEIGSNPSGSSFAADTWVYIHANAGDGYVFSHWSGDASGTDGDIYIVMDRNQSVTAHFVPDPSIGNLRVDISPPLAAAEGAAWRYDLFTAWRPSGATQNGISPRAKYVEFKDIPGWITPARVKATVIGGQTTVVSGASATYREILGGVQIAIEPAQAGGRWRLDGGAWQESGVTLPEISTGNHTIEFLAIPGWATPASQGVTVARGIVSSKTGAYGPPAGFPIVNSVSPRTGPISGGTTVTLDGANFQPGATVSFGGVPATSVAVVSPTRITAVSPPRASYGTVSLALTSGGQTVSQANGFSYLEPLGQNMELVGQLGGEFKSVDVQGNYAYVGEGASFVVLDVTNPTAPVERGRIALPSFAESIAVVGGKAYVAAGSAGLYVLDVSIPSSPAILGFFDTVEYASGVAVDGTILFLACGDGGLFVFNVSNSGSPTLLATLDTPGRAERVRVATIAGRKYALIADTSGGTRLIDVTVAAAPIEVSLIAPANSVGTQDLKVVGTTLYVAGFGTGVQIFDVSNPAQPVLKGSYGTNGFARCLDVAGTTVYVCMGDFRIASAVNPANPTLLGSLSVGSDPRQIRVAGGYAFIALGREGFKVVSISTPSAPVLRATVKGIGRVAGLALNGSTVITGNDGGGIDTVDTSNPSRPTALAHLGTERVSNIVVTGNSAVLVNYGNNVVSVVDVATPAAPVLRSTYTAVVAWGVGLMGTNPVLAANTPGATTKPTVTVLSVANPTSPQTVGSLQLSTADGIAADVTFAGSWGFVARPDWGANSGLLDIVNFATPSNPLRTSALPLAGTLYSVAVSGDANYAYVAGNDGFRIVDARAKSAPILVATVHPPQSTFTDINTVLVAGSRLYVADRSVVFVYDITNPAAPIQVAYYDVPRVSTYGTTLAVNGDLLFVAGDDAGLTILRVKDLDKPTIGITSPTTNTAYSTTSAIISLGGTATDLQGVVRVTWKNDRGGGGVAAGTNSWTVPNIQLAPGLNNLTVTAEDANGNLATDTLAVTATLPDTTPPVVTITGPRPDATFTTEAGLVTLTGSAVDGRGVVAVTWTDDRGRSGSATLTGQAWSIAPIALEFGPTTFTVTAQDSAGNSGSDSIGVLRNSPDVIPPQIAIDFPTLQQSFWTEDAVVNVSGTASDDGSLERVEWSNSRGGGGAATGTTVWSASGIALQLGVNVITVTAFDAKGNSSTDTLSVTRTLPPTVTPGAGANGGISPNSSLSVPTGGGASFNAAPSAGFVIGHWLVNGVPVQSGGTSFALSDVIGDTSVQVTFFSTNANLALLVPSAGVLTPAFSSATTSYTVTVPNSIASFSMTPTLVTPSATVTVNGFLAASGNAGGLTNLSVGANLIETVVRAEDGVTTRTYSTVVTRQSAIERWRQNRFGSSADLGDAADNADPNKNGITNLLEYALGGDPIGRTTGAGILPQAGLGPGPCLRVSFSRYLDRTDLTLTVKSSDLPNGPWSNLARSTAGGAFVILTSGATASESGTGNARTVTVCDPYFITNPSHPKRFMRLEVTR